MQGMILAAGMGKRLKELTKDNTKCMVKVNGVTLIERMLRQLDRLYLSRIVIVTGYEGGKLIDYIGTLQIKTPVCFVNNPVYDKTNNIYSLALAKEYLVREDTLLLESDLIFEDSVLSLLLEDERETLALVDKYESWMDGTCMRLGENDSIVDFVPEKLMSEMKANFETLLTQYPSGMRVNSLLAARNFGVRQEHVLTGNGAAELIKGLMEHLEGKIGFIRPTFEEYPNRCDAERSVFFEPEDEGLRYTADDLMAYFEEKGIGTLVLVNPDNPSGNYIPKTDILRLTAWCKERKIRLVLDESFVDFAEEEDATMICEDILSLYDGLAVVKSISKSYGVPGIRLGILASADEKLIAFLKEEVAIWNINSFGEFYMQIAEKYRKDYEFSLDRIREVRRGLMRGLRENPALTVFPSQANFCMAEITNGMSAGELTERLLTKHNLLIKDLSSKILRDGRQFIRLAVRNEADNEVLLEALRRELQ